MFNIAQPAYRMLRSIIAERTNRIVVWIGAGLSRPAGLPSWSQLRLGLCDALREKAATLQDEEKVYCLKQEGRIRDERDYWLAFKLLRAQLGATTYRALIRQSMEPADTCSIPSMYRSVLDLPVTGLMNLNLDRLATRAFSERNPGKAMVEFSGCDAARHMHVLKGSTPFIANLHGTASDEATWVFTKDELGGLLADVGYREFITSVLCTRTVIFIGVSADDIAVGGHLETLSGHGVDLGRHFWITARTDALTEQWAEGTQLQVIRYSDEAGDHAELAELLCDLRAYTSSDTVSPPVAMQSAPRPSRLRTPEELRQETSLSAVRSELNAYAANLLKDNPSGNYAEYDSFCSHYDEAIYRAWYINTSAPNNELLGYTLDEEVAEGAFGRVFRAHDRNGRSFAVKVLREQVRRKAEMLQGFRRGVRSMRILADRGIQGMVPYEEASEIPAFVAMEFVEGPNLHEAVTSQYCKEWSTVFVIAVQLTNIIRRAHLLPERVLHRDLRPPNIMLKDYYTDPDNIKVVVLDFDLSWHIGANEVSLLPRSGVSGFLAPEQVDRASGMSTRNAAVDSFGLGMTLYFLRTGVEPHYLQHLHATWEADLTEAIRKCPCPSWHSIPNRFSRLIFNATRHRQPERCDMGQIEGELQLLREAENCPGVVSSAELLAEELASRTSESGGYGGYRWNADDISASFQLASGVELRLVAIEELQAVRAEVEWSNRGDAQYKNVKKYLKPAIDTSVAALGARGWKILPDTHLRMGSAGFAMSIQVPTLRSALDDCAKTISQCLDRFRF